MAFTLVGYEQSVSLAAPTGINAIPDPTVRVVGIDIYVPTQLPNIVYAAAMINSAAATLRAEIQTPSLRATLNYDVSPIAAALVFGSTPARVDLRDTPLPLVGNETMEFFFQNGAAVMNRGFVWLADGALKPTFGNMYTIRATASATLVTASWVNSSLTFAQTLPAGHYQITGMRSWSANGVAARVYPVGSAWRPGVLMTNAEANVEWVDFRLGNAGVFGEFDNTTPPTVDFMGITDTAEVVFLDLIKTK